LKEAQDDFEKATKNFPKVMEKYHTDLLAWEKASASASTSKRKKAPPTLPSKPLPRMQPGEVKMFLRLCCSLKILLGRSINTEYIERGSKLLEEYLMSYRKVSSRCIHI
jgi:hypothetical protein